MYKFARILLVFSICLSIFVSTISVSALNIGQRGSSDSKTFNSVTVTYTFPMPTVNDSLNYDSIAMKDLSNYGAPGEPVLPYKTARILIPQGKELDNIQVIAGNRIKLEGKFNVEYGTTPIPVSSDIVVADKPNPSIYSSSTPFPSTLYSQVAEQYLRGYKIALLTLNPVQYIPKTGELFYYKTITVTLNFKETGEISSMFRNLPQDETRVLNVVDNPEVLETYTRTDSSLRPTSESPLSGSYNYVIITNSALNASFQPLIDSKIDKGLNATTVLVQDILNDPDYFCNGPFGDGCGSTAFNDTAARIRNFIKDAYENWGTEYVLLGGDVEIIPARGVYGFVDVENPPSPYTVDRNMPCDLYYGALDGSWNNDNDTVFGEECFIGSTNSPENGTAGDEADYFAEVYIGRAPVNTAAQVSNFVNKTLWYEQVTDDDYLKKALLIASTLDENTEAANSVDLTTEYFPQYTMTRLFERDGTYSKSAIISKINSGTHILLHDGHTNSMTMMELSGSDIDAFHNTEYFFGYSLGCYAAAFEVSDSVVEHFVYNPNGSFAFIGNSRYGWYNIGSLYGAGDQFERTFFDALNNTARNLGKALALSKEGFADSTSAIRWTYLELNLFGDPETELVTDLSTPTAHIDTNPVATRLSPAVLRGDVYLEGIAKRGTAAGATFDNYTVQYGTGAAPTTWKTLGITLVNDGQNEIVNDLLATWNTRLVTPNTVYTIKLTVYDESGRTGEDRWIVKVKSPTTVQVNPQLTETIVPKNFTVTVKINNVEELWELDIQLSWNTTLVDYVSRTVYPLLKTPADTTETLNLTTGTYHIWSKSKYPATAYSGSGNLFQMTFHAKAPGNCSLNIFSSELKKKTGESIGHDVLNGTAEIEPGVHDVAVIDISASKTVACQGLSVDVYVTVENQGSYSENFNVTAYANETALGTTQISLASYSQTEITFSWNTSGLALGNYTMSANATVVDGEEDTEDNTYTDGIITLIEPSFDVAVIDISVSKIIVGDEYPVLINVTVENQADLTCTFNVTAYADLNVETIGDEIIIGIQNITLTGENSTIITFTWDTHGVAHGNYTVSAYATPLEAESDLEDNMCIGCGVVVSIIGDMDGDFDVDLYDAVGLLARYGAKKGNPQYDPLYDIDGDGDIDLYDAVALLTHYGQKDT
jgi:hypothetical protein